MLAGQNIKTRHVPYRLLAYLLYAPQNELDWFKTRSEGTIELLTGPCSRAFRMPVEHVHDAVRWLSYQGFFTSVEKTRKRGKLIITVREPNLFGNNNI